MNELQTCPRCGYEGDDIVIRDGDDVPQHCPGCTFDDEATAREETHRERVRDWRPLRPEDGGNIPRSWVVIF